MELEQEVTQWLRQFNYIYIDVLSKYCDDSLYEYIRPLETEDEYQDNYPLWNTLFEFKEDVSERIIQEAIKLGIGIIEHPDFNTILFMTSGGHSFMDDYWIPLYKAIYNK